MRRTRGRRVHQDGAHQAARLFVAVGLLSLAYDAMPGTIGPGKLMAVTLDCINIAIGIGCRYVPWHRWRPRATLVLPVLALTNLSISITNGLLPVSSQGVWLVLVFVWIGQWQPARTAIAMGPVAAFAYAVPFAFGAPVTEGAVGSIAVSVPIAVLVARTIARKETATRLAQSGKDDALAILAAANLTDDLTGLGNRRRANLMLDSLKAGDALAILDLDHFKRVNDTFGHQKGDEVLQDLGRYLREAVRGADIAARFGGEEFIIVLRQADSSAPAGIERVLAGWRAKGPATTLSAGLAVHGSEQSYDVTFANADAALYEAKQTGRNRLVVFQPGPRVVAGI